MIIHRRLFLAGASAAAMLPRSAFAATAEGIEALHEAARSEGEVTWYTAHYSSETAERMGQRFTQIYPGVRVNVVRTTAQVAYQRLNQDLQSRVNNCDVFGSTVIAHFVDLKSRGLMMPYAPLRKDEVHPQFRDLDDGDHFHVTSSGPINLVYNTNRVSEADAPKRWTDLLDEKWNRQVAVGHPGYSGYVGNWVVLMREKYGWEYFENLAALDPHIGRSIIDVVTTVASGERLVGAGPGTTASLSASRGNPIANVSPEDGTVVIIAPSGIMADATHPNAAKLFMEFLLGPETAEIIADEFGSPIRPGAPLREGVADLGEVPTITATSDQLQTGIPEVTEAWRDTFGI